MYNQTQWRDRATQYEDLYTESSGTAGTIRHTPYEGTVEEPGTPINAVNLNNMEHGIQDITMAFQIFAVDAYHKHQTDIAHQTLIDSEVLGEQKEVKLTNTAKYPFNSTMDIPVSVDLTKVRKNMFYSVECEVKSHKGEVGELIISQKATNGFKLSFNGAGSEAVVTVRVKGGMT